MKFAVSAVPLSRATRRRIGKMRVEIIDTSQNEMFSLCDTPQSIEQKYEMFWNDLNPESTETVKVVDVRNLNEPKRRKENRRG